MTSIPSKEQLRQSFLAIRESLAPKARLQAAGAVARLFSENVALSPGAVVAGYWPIRGEVDDRPILGGVPAVALPCVRGEAQPLVFRAWDGKAPLEAGRYGIPEPSGAEVFPDIILVPLVAFDTKKHRLGYGAGYYDRTLAHLRAQGRSFLAVGLAYEQQLCEAGLPTGANDATMDMIVTDKKVYR